MIRLAFLTNFYFQVCEKLHDESHVRIFLCFCLNSSDFFSCYRGYRIDWAPDECAAPFKKHRPTPKNQAPKKPKPTPPTNRFELLDMADEGVDSKEV